jgi:RNA polymerase sigma-70 factor (ECF subfamily)
MINNGLIGEIYEAYYTVMFRYARKYIHNNADIEDLIHDIFTKLLIDTAWLANMISKSEHPHDLRRMLFAFLHNSCCNHCRHVNNTNKIFSDVPYSELTVISTDEEQNNNRTDAAILWDNINRLNERNRDIFVKYYIDGFSMRELAEQTGLSPRTVESSLYRALKLLKKSMGI